MIDVLETRAAARAQRAAALRRERKRVALARALVTHPGGASARRAAGGRGRGAARPRARVPRARPRRVPRSRRSMSRIRWRRSRRSATSWWCSSEGRQGSSVRVQRRQRREGHGEASAAGAFARRADLAVVQLDDVAGDGQSSPRPLALVRAFGLAKAVEDVRQERGSMPSLRPSRGRAACRRRVELEVDHLARRSELDGVGQRL